MKKKEETKLVKKEEITPEEKQKQFDRHKQILSNPDYFIKDDKKIKELVDLYFLDKEDNDTKNRKEVLAAELSYAFNLENGMLVTNLSYSKYSPALARMRKRIIKDYNCNDPLEIMLADSITASYWRMMRYERVSNLLCEKEDGGWTFDQLKINLLKEVNKGLELSNRHLNNNIILLKEMKQPKLNIRVKADNAYIAQNQQINNKEQSEKPLEANDLGK